MLSLEETLTSLEQTSEPPAVENIICILQKCRKKRNLAYAKRLHAYMCKNELEVHRALGNHLVPTLLECGSLSDAEQVFNRLPFRNQYSWNCLIVSYIELGKLQHALHLYQKMREDCVHPSNHTFLALLKACGRLKDGERGKQICGEIATKGLEVDLFVGSTLVDMFGKCGLLAEAHRVFEKLPDRDVCSWNALIAGYAEHGYGEEALICFKQMQLEGVSPDAVTFVCSLKACGSVGAIERGRQIRAEVANRGLESDLYVGSTLVGMFGKCGLLADACEVFEKLPVRNVVSWNALITGYAEHGSGKEALTCFEQMQLEGISPDAVTLACILKACGSLGALARGRKVYAIIAKNGLDSDLFVGSSLVDMFGKCGSLAEAQYAFDRLPVRNAVLWNTLITSYAEQGLGKEALICFEQMQLEGLSPDAVTFVCSLKACGTIKAIERGRDIHAEIAKRGLENDVFVGSASVNMFGKCGSFVEACEVFDKLLVRNIVSWTALVAGYAEHGLSEEVLYCFSQMQLQGLFPDAVTLVYNLKACGRIRAIEMGCEMYAEITKKGLEREISVSNTVVDMFGKCGSLAEAQNVFNKLPVQDLVSWNALMAGYAEHGFCKEALECFEQMQLVCICPDCVTFVCNLKSCGSMKAIGLGREIYTEIVRKGLESDMFVGSTMVDMFGKCGLLAEANHVFDRLLVQNVVSWNSVIAGYAEHGLGEGGLNCLNEMQLEGVSPDAVSFVCSLKACGTIGAIDAGREIYVKIVREGLESDHFLGSTLVDMFRKCDTLAESHEVFDRLTVRNTVTWSALIAGYAEHGLGEEALNCFEQAQFELVSVDAVILVCCLTACGGIGAIERGKEIHAEIAKTGLERELFVGSSLLDMYGKCGLLSDAQKVFEKLLTRDVVAWNAMIEGYGMNHEGDMAVQCFEDMQEQAVKPNAITFMCLLVACGHANLVFKGQELFIRMREEYGIEPTRDHYDCMVDLLARSGHVYEAERFVETIQYPPSKEMWTSLLSACNIYGKVGLGLRCFQHLVQMNPEDAPAYVMMANLYTSAGRWDDVNRLEHMREHVGAKKRPASALIEVNKMVHDFVVGNKKSMELSEMLENLNSRIKDQGYVPNLDLVLRHSSEEKQHYVRLQRNMA